MKFLRKEILDRFFEHSNQAIINIVTWSHIIFSLAYFLFTLYSKDPFNVLVSQQISKAVVAQAIYLVVFKYTKSETISTFLFFITTISVIFIFKSESMHFIFFNMNFLVLIKEVEGLLMGIFLACISIAFKKKTSKIFTIDDSEMILSSIMFFSIFVYLYDMRLKIISKRQANEVIIKIIHELKTPLFGIVGGLSAFDYKNLPEEQKNLISIIKTCSDNLLEQANNVLNISKSEFQEKPIEDIINCKKFIKNVIKIVTHQARQKNHTIHTKISKSCPVHFISDASRLKQILINILFNSIKYTPPRGIIIFSVDIRKTDSGVKELVFSVTDNGVGIEKAELNRIFENFHRADSYTSKNFFGGIGVGLSIAKSFAQSIGACITANSKGVNCGSTFTVSLPCKEPDIEYIERKYKLISSREFQQKDLEEDSDREDDAEGDIKVEVLIADDNRINQFVLERLIKTYNPKIIVHVCKDGNEVLEKVKSNKSFSLIMLDLEMPNLDGKSTAIKLKDMGLKMPIIILSGHSVDHQTQLLGNLDVDKMTKPLTLSSLEKLFKKYSL